MALGVLALVFNGWILWPSACLHYASGSLVDDIDKTHVARDSYTGSNGSSLRKSTKNNIVKAFVFHEGKGNRDLRSRAVLAIHSEDLCTYPEVDKYHVDHQATSSTISISTAARGIVARDPESNGPQRFIAA